MSEAWIAAGLALISNTPPDPRPLAALLRGGEPIPAGTRELLAELLDPREPEYLFRKLELVSTVSDSPDVENKRSVWRYDENDSPSRQV